MVFFQRKNLPKGYYSRLISRNVVFLFFGMLFYFAPTLVQTVRFHGHPKAIEAYKVYHSNQSEENHLLYTKEIDRIVLTDKEFKKRYDEER